LKLERNQKKLKRLIFIDFNKLYGICQKLKKYDKKQLLKLQKPWGT